GAAAGDRPHRGGAEAAALADRPGHRGAHPGGDRRVDPRRGGPGALGRQRPLAGGGERPDPRRRRALSSARTAGLVLAAGEGRRCGGPKAPVAVDGTRLVDRAVDLLRTAGCDPVVVILGAWVGDVPGATVVVNESWPEGMGSSLRTGLAACEPLPVDRVLV